MHIIRERWFISPRSEEFERFLRKNGLPLEEKKCSDGVTRKLLALNGDPRNPKTLLFLNNGFTQGDFEIFLQENNHPPFHAPIFLAMSK